MNLSPRHKRQIRQIVSDHHLALIVSLCGPDTVTADELARLQAAKLVKLPARPIDFVTAGHLLGEALHDATDEQSRQMSPVDFWQRVRTLRSQTTAEQEAIASAKAVYTEHIRSLGSKLEQQMFTTLLAHYDAARRSSLATKDRQKLARGIADKDSFTAICAALSESTQALRKDWKRLVYTELHNHVEEGKALALIKLGHGDVRVYKKPKPDACPFCKLLYLQPNGIPRVFRLSDLMKNGTNVGRKAGKPLLEGASKTQWKAVLGAMHPWCRCSLHYIQDGYGFNTSGVIVPMKKAVVTLDAVDHALLSHRCV